VSGGAGRLAALLVATGCLQSPPTSPGTQPDAGEAEADARACATPWDEEFSGTELDLVRWMTSTDTGSEVLVENGSLTLTADATTRYVHTGVRNPEALAVALADSTVTATVLGSQTPVGTDVPVRVVRRVGVGRHRRQPGQDRRGDQPQR
jgi:hypothetical protein